jgi:hypothetical protein
MEERQQRLAKKSVMVEAAVTPPASPNQDEVAPASGQRKVGGKKVKKEDRRSYYQFQKQTDQIRRLQN